jgi:hypothetical protein
VGLKQNHSNELRIEMTILKTLTLSLGFAMLAFTAQAETACVAPNKPIIPPSFTNLAEAEASEAALQTYLVASGQYQKCLSEERAAYAENITPDQDAELTALKSAAMSQAQSTAGAYNSAVIALHSN